jgi:hypothetical protein
VLQLVTLAGQGRERRCFVLSGWQAARGEEIVTGLAHTHRIPRPVLTPRQGSGQAPPRGGASLPRRCGQPVVVGFFSAVSPMAPFASLSRCQQQVSAQQAQTPSRSALRAREALVRSAPRCRAGERPAPYQRRCITGALHHHLRDRVRQVRSPHRLHEQGCCPLGHFSLDASGDSEPCLLDQLPAGPGRRDRSVDRGAGASALCPCTAFCCWMPLPLLQACDRPGRSAVGRIREYGPTGTIGEGEPWRSWSPATCCCWPVR